MLAQVQGNCQLLYEKINEISQYKTILYLQSESYEAFYLHHFLSKAHRWNQKQ